jgi:hypothetical protein
MTNGNPEWTRREQISMDKVSYEVKVRRANSGFSGAWECLECHAQGQTSLISETEEQASERAQVSLYAHHILVHRSTDAGDSGDAS